jgi:hypothetical protein
MFNPIGADAHTDSIVVVLFPCHSGIVIFGAKAPSVCKKILQLISFRFIKLESPISLLTEG